MARTSIERYKVDTNKINIPDEGLGKFLDGFTEENKPFNWNTVLFNLIPFAGQLFFVAFILKHWWEKTHAQRVLLYRNGFIKQTLDRKGHVKKEIVIDFREVNGILYKKTRGYQICYGIRIYNGTDVELTVLDTNNFNEVILSGRYRNEHEVDGRYNFIGYACNAISNLWLQFAIDKFNSELTSTGYGTFSTPSETVRVGRDFIQVDDIIVTKGYGYSFDNGYFYLYPNFSESSHFKQKAKPISIHIAEMYNRDVFLMALSQLHGIGQ